MFLIDPWSQVGDQHIEATSRGLTHAPSHQYNGDRSLSLSNELWPQLQVAEWVSYPRAGLACNRDIDDLLAKVIARVASGRPCSKSHASYYRAANCGALLNTSLRVPLFDSMRRLLLVTLAYPPVQIVGAVRPAALAKYLPRFGWESVVLTRKAPGRDPQPKRIIETDSRDILQDWKAKLHLDSKRSVHEQFGLPMAKTPGSLLPHTRVLALLRSILTYPDLFKGWIPYALAAVENIHRQKLDIDAIVTTSPPISCHLIGRQAKNILGCPWVADLRDLWTQNLAERNGRFLQRGLERRTLRDADVLVTVSTPWAERLQQRYPDKKVCTIPNGFDPDDFRSPPPPLTREFSITYAGQLYEGQRDPTMLFAVLRDLVTEGAICTSELRVRFFGPVENWLPSLINKYGLTQVIEVHGPLPRHMVLERERESQILLVLPWSDPRETGHHSAKLFEYFGAARPILAVGGNRGVLTQALEETRAGVHALSKGQVREFLLAAYAQYREYGRVLYSGRDDAIAKYSHPEMARTYADVLNDVLHERAHTNS